MNRRENLKSLGMLTTHTLFPTVLSSFFSSCSAKDKIIDYQPVYFKEHELKVLVDLVDFVIPATDSPGASDAGAHIFIDKYVKECYTPEQQENFKAGLRNWEKIMNLKPNEKSTLLSEKERDSRNSKSEESQFIGSLKNLVLLGYFLSEKGAVASSYAHVPGIFRSCIELNP